MRADDTTPHEASSESDDLVVVWIVSPTFPLGQIVATPGALALLEETGTSPMEYLKRHSQGDWGELDVEDKQANDHALDHEERLLSAYKVTETDKIWIITEYDRSVTTILLPSEY